MSTFWAILFCAAAFAGFGWLSRERGCDSCEDEECGLRLVKETRSDEKD